MQPGMQPGQPGMQPGQPGMYPGQPGMQPGMQPGLDQMLGMLKQSGLINDPNVQAMMNKAMTQMQQGGNPQQIASQIMGMVKGSGLLDNPDVQKMVGQFGGMAGAGDHMGQPHVQLPNLGQMAEKADAQQMSAEDLLKGPQAQVLRTPDGHQISIPFPPTPPDPPIELDREEITSQAFGEHADDLLKALNAGAKDKNLARAIQAFGGKNALKDWTKNPDKFEELITSNSSDPKVGHLFDLLSHTAAGKSVMAEVMGDIDTALEDYNDSVAEYDKEYEDYQSAFQDHLANMSEHVLPTLAKFGMIDQGQLQHALNSIYESGGVLDVSSVMPDAEIIDGAEVSDDSSGSGFDYSIFDKQSAEDADSTDDGSEDWGADESSDDSSANLSTSDDSVDDSISEDVVTEEDTTGTQNS